MTRKEALIKHRALWNKIAEMLADPGYPLKDMTRWTILYGSFKYSAFKYSASSWKLEALRELRETKIPENMCYCCEITDSDCDDCLVIWGNNPNIRCANYLGEYSKFINAINHTDWDEAAKIAKVIANLPARRLEDDESL